MVRALVVDDQRAFADAVALALDSQPGLACIGAAGTVDEALAVMERECPDVVLLDLRLPGVSGVDAVALLRERCAACRILMLTAHPSPVTLVAAIRAGVDGFLPKDTPFSAILQAVRQEDRLLVDGGSLDLVVRSEVVLQSERETRPVGPPAPHLTVRETQVLQMLAEGLPVKQVARQLGMSVHTCRGHVRALRSKLEVHSQLAAVVKAARLGLLAERPRNDGGTDGAAGGDGDQAAPR